jgi:hypothetical protein
MTSPPTPDLTQRKITRLCAAVWILAILLCVTLLASFVVIRSLSVSGSKFDHLSPEQRVQAASVIALTRWERSGSSLRCVITEILKQGANTAFYYKVGDELHSHQQKVRDNTDYGDGEILFFAGSPARLEETAAYRGDRITALGDMPIGTLREIIAASK